MAVVAKYSGENGDSKAVQHFKYNNVKLVVRDWMYSYEKCHEKCKVATTG